MALLNRSGNLSNTNKSEEVIINYMFHNVTYIILLVYIVIASVVGIMGNMLVIIVYFQRKDKKASSAFIKILAVLDLMVCSSVMPYTIVYELHLVTSDISCRLLELVRHFSIGASNITLAAIAIERYVAVCKIGTRITVKSVKKGVVCIAVISLFNAMPSIGTFAVVTTPELSNVPCTFPHENTSGSFCHFTYSIMGQGVVTIYQGVQMAFFFLILIIIIVLYTIIYVVLWKKTKIRLKLTNSRESCVLSEFRASLPENVSVFSKHSIKREACKSTPNDTDNYGLCSACYLFKDTYHCDGQAPVQTFQKVGNDKSETNVKFVHIKAEHSNEDVNLNECVNSTTVPATGDDNLTAVTATRQLLGVSDKTKRKRYNHRRTAKMLFMSTVIYFVTWMPFWIDIFRLTNSRLLRYVFFIGNATNPIVYGIINEQVRKGFKKIICDFIRKLRNGNKCDTTDDMLNGSFSGTSLNDKVTIQ